MNKLSKIAGAAAAATLVAISGTAFTASNSMPLGTTAGAGTQAVTGYTVSDITYTHNTDYAKLDAISFTLSAPATFVALGTKTDGSVWFRSNDVAPPGTSSCVKASGTERWTCDVKQLAVDAVEVHTVVATK